MPNLTLIYSTRHPDPTFRHHLQDTCGLPDVEILAYTNPGQYSLSTLYNRGLAEANHFIVVFLHDDLHFETPNWGPLLLQHFQHSNFGILGIAGTTELPQSGQWWQHPLTTLGIVKHQHQQQIWTSKYSGDFQHRILPAVCVDGVFMAVNKNLLQEEFNEQFTGFHFYDIDFCLNNHLAGVKVGVIFNLSILHQSIGQPTAAWEQVRLQFLTYHRYNLPCTIQPDLIFEDPPVSLNRYPKVTVIILHKSNNTLLFNCLNSFAEICRYPHYEIIIADTGSTPLELEEIYQLVNTSTLQIKVIEFNKYHFGQINNTIVFQYTDTHSDLLLFCNNDIELVNDALTRMVKVYLDHPEQCGTIGGRLHFADNKIQHAGIHLTFNPLQPLQIGHRGYQSNYQYSNAGVEAGVVGSTAAFLLMERSLFEQIGGFNTAYAECLEDVELNLTCLQQHRINYFVNDAVCYHFESQTRTQKGVMTKDEERLKFFCREFFILPD
jgi:GT2 family glycosyltransferase